jgi:peptidoglycan/LPS O-acetylase OafA/YrhL
VVLRTSVSGIDAGSIVGGTLLGYFMWFALGMALAVGSVALGDRELPGALVRLARFPSLCWALALVLYAVLCASLPETPFLFDSGQSLWTHLAFGAVALLLIAPAIFADPDAALSRRVLGNPLLAWLGLVSYGIFLWHYVVAVELGTYGSGLSFWPLLGATLAISIAAASISYYLLERPLLRLK